MSESEPVRIAVEGCGHGTLDAIYASVQKSCEVRGWDGVDLLIICGDFQAVRTRQDLNVTAMPAKYREMGDFHQYYYGTKKAPYLTMFIGGNHEASNYLFELYYGGWVAPNIYYMGAANVLKLGTLKIAALSGIWKGRDYQKQHFERLPYNESDMRSIYHQRELDVRKLLAYTTQIDVGMSHDWPHDIWQYGDHQQLFRVKTHFKADADQGNLGSKAVTQVVDRLRPPFWFSAHLHFKYIAYKNHDPVIENVADDQNQQTLSNGRKRQRQTFRGDQNNSANPSTRTLDSQRPMMTNGTDTYAASAWSNFGANIQEQDARTHREALQSQLEEEKHGKSTVANYNFEETFKPVTIGEANNAYLRISQPIAPVVPNLPQYDGSSFSLPKRRRLSSPSRISQSTPNPTTTGQDSAELIKVTVKNPDAIDIDMSDSDEGTPAPTDKDNQTSQSTVSASLGLPVPTSETSDNVLKESQQHHEANTNRLPDPAPTETVPQPLDESVEAKSSDREPNATSPLHGTTDVEEHTHDGAKADGASQDEIPAEIRAELAAISNTFVEKEKIERSPDLPLPADITNKVTKFLALSKVEQGHDREFLQLLEIQPSTISSTAVPLTRPLRLEYDPEWLAILRTFSSELQVGGMQSDRVPSSRGDTHYRNRIFENRVWVDENIKKEDLMVPENFQVTVERDEDGNAVNQGAQEMPIEQTNPQTADFCKLIDIDNKFDFSEEDRAARTTAGPAPDHDGGSFRGRGRGGGRGGGRGWGRGRGRGRRGRW